MVHGALNALGASVHCVFECVARRMYASCAACASSSRCVAAARSRSAARLERTSSVSAASLRSRSSGGWATCRCWIASASDLGEGEGLRVRG